MTVEKAKNSDIFKYSFGGLASNIPFLLAMGYLQFFYTDIFQISPLAVGVLMMVARVIDAVTDPMMGMISDRTRSRFGRFRPWIIGGAPVLGVLIYLLFSAPALSPMAKIVYAYIVYIGFSLASTVTNIPYHSLTPVMSQDTHQRTVVAIAKQTMAVPGQLLVLVAGLPLVDAFGGGTAGWSRFGLLCGVCSMVFFWICAWGAKPYDTMEVVKNQPSIPLKKQLQLIFKNRPLLMLMIAFGTDLIAFAAAQGVNMYFFVYVLGRKDLVAPVALLGLVANLLAMLLIPLLAKKFGKKPLYMGATVLVIVPLIVLFLVPPTQVMVISALLVLTGMVAAIPGNLGWAMLADCVEYGEWKLGIRGEGTVTSALTFINKLGMAIGALLTGAILTASGYLPNVPQTDAAIEAIRLLRFIFPVLGYICSIASMSFYNITNEFYKKMVSEIKERNAENPVAASPADIQ